MTDAVEQFRDAMRARGIIPPANPVADGQIHRCDAEGENGKGRDDASYLLHLDGRPAGGFQNHRDGQGWENWKAEGTVPPPRVLLRSLPLKGQSMDAKRIEAQQRALRIWRQAEVVASEHPYLKAKRIRAHGARIHLGSLVLPLRHGPLSLINSLHFIKPDGSKVFLKGGRTAGCFCMIGRPSGTVCIAEGFATAASIHEATGDAVMIAFNAGNLLAVAEVTRSRFPDAKIVVCADNDIGNDINVGVEKAREAARLVGGMLAIPELNDAKCDFNDLAVALGDEAVRAAIAAAKKPRPLEHPKTDAQGLSLIRGSDLKPEAIRWLWREWLALGKLHIVAGASGSGKTTIAMALAAIVTSGTRWPDGSNAPRGNVLIWSGEDSPGDTLLPRLLAHGADQSRVYFVGDISADGTTQPFDPAYDMAALLAKASEIGDNKLIIVDPIVNAVAGDSHNNTAVRRSLQPLVDLATRLDAAVLGISHFSKNTSGREPLERVTGSLAFGALARVVLGTAKTQEEDGTTKRMLVRAKSNIGPDGGGFEYALDQECVPGQPEIPASRVHWSATSRVCA